MEKILIVRFKFLPITETFNYDELSYLKGYKPMVFCRYRINSDKFPWVFFVPYSAKRVCNWFHVFLSDCCRMQYFKEKKEQKEIAYLRQYITEEKIRVIHAHFFDEMLFCMNVIKGKDCSLVVSLHGGVDLARFEKLNDEFIAEINKNVSRIIVKSCVMKNRLLSCGIESDKIIVFYRGIDLDKWTCTQTKQDLYTKKTILFVGRCLPKKGIIQLMEAYNLLRSSNQDDICLTLVLSYGCLFDRVCRLLVNLIRFLKFDLNCLYPEQVLLRILFSRYRKNIQVYRNLAHQEVMSVIQNSDIVAVPSVEGDTGRNEEGIPRVMIEAQASGRPVVVSDYQELDEGYLDGITGKKCDVEDVRCFSDALNAITFDSNIFKRMGHNAQNFVRGRFDLRCNIELLENTYSELLR